MAPLKKLRSNAWAFSRPFTLKLWCATGVAIVLVGVVVWILERRVNEEFRHGGNPRKQIFTIFWYTYIYLYIYFYDCACVFINLILNHFEFFSGLAFQLCSSANVSENF